MHWAMLRYLSKATAETVVIHSSQGAWSEVARSWGDAVSKSKGRWVQSAVGALTRHCRFRKLQRRQWKNHGSGYGCIQVRDEIMVKAWCAWCARRCFPHCKLMCTTRRWLGGLVDRLGSWTDFNLRERPGVARNDKKSFCPAPPCRALPCNRGGDGVDRACRQPVRWAPNPHKTSAANERCSGALGPWAALGSTAKDQGTV